MHQLLGQCPVLVGAGSYVSRMTAVTVTLQ